MSHSMHARSLELEGNSFASKLPERQATGKIHSLQCLDDAIQHSGLDAKQIADACGMTEAQFSKARREAAGGGRLSDLIDKLPAPIRHDYGCRLTEQDSEAMQSAAAEALAHAALRYLRVCGQARPKARPAKAGLR